MLLFGEPNSTLTDDELCIVVVLVVIVEGNFKLWQLYSVLAGLKTLLTRHIDLHFGAACDMRHVEFNQVFPFASKLKTYVPRHFAHVLRQVKTNAAIKQTYFMHGDRK